MAWDLRSQAEADHLTPQLVTRIIDRGCDPGKVTSRWPMVTTWPVALLTKFCWRAVLYNVFFRGITLLSDVYFTPWLLASLVDTLSKSVLLEGDSKPSEVDVLVACMVYCLARMVSNYAQTTSNYFGSLNRERILVIIPTWVYRRCLVTPLNVLLPGTLSNLALEQDCYLMMNSVPMLPLFLFMLPRVGVLLGQQISLIGIFPWGVMAGIQVFNFAVQGWSAWLIKNMSIRRAQAGDVRQGLIESSLDHMKLIKYNGYETERMRVFRFARGIEAHRQYVLVEGLPHLVKL